MDLELEGESTIDAEDGYVVAEVATLTIDPRQAMGPGTREPGMYLTWITISPQVSRSSLH